MRLVVSLAMAAALCIAGSATAQQNVDLASFRCKAFLAADSYRVQLIVMWLEGYYMEESASPIVDFETMKQRIGKFTEHCGRNPDQSLIDAAELLMSK